MCTGTYKQNTIQLIFFRAFIDLDKGNVHMAKTMLYDANINRSPTSYLLNPPDELDMYAEEGDTDKTFLQLNFIDEKNAIPKGIVNWFPVHGTSMNVTNTVRVSFFFFLCCLEDFILFFLLLLSISIYCIFSAYFFGLYSVPSPFHVLQTKYSSYLVIIKVMHHM